MFEFTYLPNCNDQSMVGGMSAILIVSIMMAVCLRMLSNENEKTRLLGGAGISLGFLIGLFPMFEFLNILFFCNVDQVDTSYFWSMNILANATLVLAACGFAWMLCLLIRFNKKKDVNDNSTQSR